MTRQMTESAQDSQESDGTRQRDSDPDTSAENIPTKITIVSERPLTFAGAVRLRGEVISITPELVHQSRDREGHSFLTLDADGQTRKYGEVKFQSSDHAAEIAQADNKARAEEVQARARAEDPGMQALRDVWAESAAAEAR